MRIVVGLIFVALGAAIAIGGAETLESNGNPWELSGQILAAFFIPLLLCILGIRRLSRPEQLDPNRTP